MAHHLHRNRAILHCNRNRRTRRRNRNRNRNPHRDPQHDNWATFCGNLDLDRGPQIPISKYELGETPSLSNVSSLR